MQRLIIIGGVVAAALIVILANAFYIVSLDQQAIVLTQPISPRTEVLTRLLDVPVIGEVDGALKWAAPGDVALVDADHGFVILNPSRAEVASLRAWRKRAGHEADEAVPTLRTT